MSNDYFELYKEAVLRGKQVSDDANAAINILQSQLEREQKCVELALETLHRYNNLLSAYQVKDNACNDTITKIKSLREGEIK